MIVKSNKGDIFETEAKHIVFAINTEGLNDSGFAGLIADKFWPELRNTGELKLGTVLSKSFGGKTFHAIVCHSLRNGWGMNQSEVIRKTFDKIPSNGEPVASIAIGNGLVGVLSGANVEEIIFGMMDSNQQVILYGGFDLEKITSAYEKRKGKGKTLI